MVKPIVFKQKVAGSLTYYQNDNFFFKKLICFLEFNREANADILVVVSMLITFSSALTISHTLKQSF